MQEKVKAAIETGERILTVDAVKILGDPGAVEADPSLNLLRQRVQIMKMGADSDANMNQSSKSSHLFYEACLKDPYLRDLQSTLLDQDTVQTLGRIHWVRNVSLDLQPSIVKVQEQMDIQKSAFEILRKVASCCMVEGNTWLSGVAALIKAQKDEATKVSRAEEAERLAKEKKERKEREAAAKKAAKAAQKEAERLQREATHTDEPEQADDVPREDDNKRRPRRRGMGKANEFDDSDPAVLRELSTNKDMTQTKCVDKFEDFVDHIAAHPNEPCVVRFKKACVRKVLAVPPIQLISFLFGSGYRMAQTPVHNFSNCTFKPPSY